MRHLVLLSLLLASCGTNPRADDAILALGDSIMAWNGNRGIPEAVAAELDRPVTDASRSLARISNGNVIAGTLGFDISRQFDGGDWDWVILTGGGNDIRDACATPRAAPERNALIGPDLEGEIPALIDRIRSTGAKVAFVGYYDGAEAAPTGFTPCQPEFDIMNERLSRLAARDPGFLFFDAGDVVDASDRSLYASDLLHPSARGSEIIGTALARAMRAVE